MGKGNNGAVIKCELVDYVGTDNTVAVKMFYNLGQIATNQLTNEFKSEWELLRGYLQPHQHIIRILKVFTQIIPQQINELLQDFIFDTPSAKFIVMEYHPFTLQKYLKSSVPTQERFRFCQELSKGLFYLFQNQIIHGDMKLDNILVSTDGTLVITDFGTAFRVVNDPTFTKERSKPGNPSHLAPEIINTPFGKPVSYLKQPSWELGVLCFEIIHFCFGKDVSSHPFGNYPIQFAQGKTSVDRTEVKFTQNETDFPENFFQLVKLMLKDFETRILFPEAVQKLGAMKF